MKRIKKSGGYADFERTRNLVKDYLGDRFDWVAFGKAFDDSNVARRSMAREIAGRYGYDQKKPKTTKEAIALHADAIKAVGR